MADVVALVVRQSAFARDPHGDIEDLADRHAGFHGADRCFLARKNRGVEARQLIARLAEHHRTRDVRAVSVGHAAEIEAHHVAEFESALGRVHVGQCSPFADRDHSEEGLGATPEDLGLVHVRRLALGDARLEHRQHRGHAGLGDLRRALQSRDLFWTLDHARPPEELVGGRQGALHALLERPPGRGEQAALVHTNTGVEDTEVPEDLEQRVYRARRRRPRPVPHLAADHARVVGVLEEELAVAGQRIGVDLVRGDAARVDERDDQTRTPPREDAVELEPSEERVSDRAEAGDVLEVLRRGRDEGVESFGVEHLRQSRPRMAHHERLLT